MPYNPQLITDFTNSSPQGEGFSAINMMNWLYGFVLALFVVVDLISARSLDEDFYKDYIRNISPDVLQRLKELQWAEAPREDYPVQQGGDIDWALYGGNADVPRPLQDVPQWPSQQDKIVLGQGKGLAADTNHKDEPSMKEVPTWPGQQARDVVGQVGGLATDINNNVVVFHRADRQWDKTSFGLFDVFNSVLGPIQSDVIMTIDPHSGDIVSQAGAGQFYMPHGLTVDNQGNMWLTDVALHQVIKINKGSTKPAWVMGEKLVPGSDDSHFCKPTDVAVASNGDFFVADGYCNGRIMKFAANKTLLAKWGRKASGPNWNDLGPAEFNIPHSLALVEKRDLICVADREDGRIQCFDAGLNGTTAGAFRKSFVPGRGTIYAIEYDPNDDVIYAVNGPGIGVTEGFTLDMDGNILGAWGPENQELGRPHDVTVSRDGASVYVGEIGDNPQVWKFQHNVARQGAIVGKYRSNA